MVRQLPIAGVRRWILIEGRDRGAHLHGNSWCREDRRGEVAVVSEGGADVLVAGKDVKAI